TITAGSLKHLFKHARRSTGGRSGSRSLRMAFVVITIVVEVPKTRASTSVKLVVSYRCTNNCGDFRCVVNLGLCGEISREAHSIDIHRNIRSLLVLMLNVQMLMAYQHSTRSAGPAAARNDE